MHSTFNMWLRQFS